MAERMHDFKFKPLRQEDLKLLHQWFQEPDINYWYGENEGWSLAKIKENYEPRILGREKVPSFIVHESNIPLGYIQYYLLTDYLPDGVHGYNHPLFKQYQSEDLAGVDLFIAMSASRGKGTGVLLLNQFILEFLTGFKAIIVDPNINNLQAICCYEKCGFVKTTFSEDPKHLIMIKAADSE